MKFGKEDEVKYWEFYFICPVCGFLNKTGIKIPPEKELRISFFSREKRRENVIYDSSFGKIVFECSRCSGRFEMGIKESEEDGREK